MSDSQPAAKRLAKARDETTRRRRLPPGTSQVLLSLDDVSTLLNMRCPFAVRPRCHADAVTTMALSVDSANDRYKCYVTSIRLVAGVAATAILAVYEDGQAKLAMPPRALDTFHRRCAEDGFPLDPEVSGQSWQSQFVLEDNQGLSKYVMTPRLDAWSRSSRNMHHRHIPLSDVALASGKWPQPQLPLPADMPTMRNDSTEHQAPHTRTPLLLPVRRKRPRDTDATASAAVGDNDQSSVVTDHPPATTTIQHATSSPMVDPPFTPVVSVAAPSTPLASIAVPPAASIAVVATVTPLLHDHLSFLQHDKLISLVRSMDKYIVSLEQCLGLQTLMIGHGAIEPHFLKLHTSLVEAKQSITLQRSPAPASRLSPQ